MNYITISLQSMLCIACLLPLWLMSAENRGPQYGFCAVNGCLQDIELIYLFPLPNEYTTTAPSECRKVRAGEKVALPVNMDNLCIKIGQSKTKYLFIEDKKNPMLISKQRDGHLVVYQAEKRHYLELQQLEKESEGFWQKWWK